MITKLPFFLISSKLSSSTRFLTTLSTTTYIQPTHQPNPTNQTNQTHLTSSQYLAKIQSLNNHLHPETLINIITSTQDLDSSLRLFKWVSLQNQFQHTSETYYHIILKLGLASRVDEVEGFCNEMVKVGFLDVEQALLRLVDVFVVNHMFDAAFRVFCVFNSSGYKLSVALVNRLLRVVVEGEKEGKGKIDYVVFIYKEMVKAGICPTTETLNYLMEGLFDADRVDSAMDQFKRMGRKGCCPDSRTYEIVVSGLIGKKVMDKAFVVLNEVLENGCDLDSEFFLRVLPLLFEMNEYEIGLRLFEKMKSLKVVPDLLVYEVLVTFFARKRCMDDAISLFDEMISNDLKPSDCVFVDLVNGLCVLKKLSEAKQFLEEQKVTEANSYNVLLKGYCQAGDYAETMWLFQRMVEKNLTNSLSWNILIRYLSENQGNDIIYKALTKMIVSGYVPDSTTYSALIIGNCKSDKVDDALSLFHHICEEQSVLDSSCYDALVQCLCQTNKIQDAVDVFHYIVSNKSMVHASSFSMLIQGLCLNGEVNKVINLLPLASCSGLSCSSEDYNIIMKSMNNISKGNNILVIIGRMVVEGCPLSSETYNQLIKSTGEHQRSTECALYINRMVKDGLLPDREILFSSLSFLAQKFQLHTVLPAIHKLLPVSDHGVLNQVICNVLINGLWKEGYRDEARLLLDMTLEKGWVPDSTTHRLLINPGPSDVYVDEKDDTQDEITNILCEGFGEL